MTDEFMQMPSEEDMVALQKVNRKKMRICFNRCGWALFALIGFWMFLMVGVSAFVGATAQVGSPLYQFYNDNLLLLNEATLGIAILVSALILKSVPKAPFEKKSFSAKRFFTVLLICFAVGSAGNMIGNAWISVWNGLTGNEVSNEVADLMMEMEPWQVFLSAGILAPILEELFFRKFLIDRMRPYGEVTCMLVSGILFALFHQNFSQFFYAFGVGAILACVYYRSGKYLHVMLLHLMFNIISGVLPSLLIVKLMPYLEAFETGSEQEILALTAEYAVPLLFYLFILLLMGTFTIAGVVLIILNAKKFRPESGSVMLNAKEKRKAAFLNPGIIVSVALLLIITILSLFTV